LKSKSSTIHSHGHGISSSSEEEQEYQMKSVDDEGDENVIGDHDEWEDEAPIDKRWHPRIPSPVTFAATTSVATKLRTAVKAHTMNSISQTNAKVHKPFVPIDFETMRHGLLQGGVNTKTTNSAGTSIFIVYVLKIF
jgi:hypothetical protein